MLIYEQYRTTTCPDSNLNRTAIDIKTLYALINSSFWIETINMGRPIVYINGSHIIIPRQSRRDIVLARPCVRPHFLSVRNHISVPIGEI